MNIVQRNSIENLYALPNAYPGIDLARTTRRFVELKDRAGAINSFNRKDLVDVLGFGPNSGGANMVISALMHFGFMKRTETDYFYTELGDRLAASKAGSREYAGILSEALRTPDLYKWLAEKYTQLPDEIEDILIGRYHDRGVKKENVKAIISNYLKSVAFASASHNHTDEPSGDDYISISIRENKILVYKKYLLEAIQKTREDELTKIYESLS